MTDELNLQTSDEGVLLPVHAQPKASRNGIFGIHDGGLKVAVTQAPEKVKRTRLSSRRWLNRWDCGRVKSRSFPATRTARRHF